MNIDEVLKYVMIPQHKHVVESSIAFVRRCLRYKMTESRQYFSPLEKSIITELVRKHKDILENKRNDYRTIQQKINVWEALSEEFNSQSGVTKRISQQLKKCWKNIKSRAKKQLAKEKRESKLTGGGPASSKQDDVRQC